GTYTPQTLVQQLQSTIDGSTDLQGHRATVGLTGNDLTIISAAYGSVSQVKIGSGAAATALGFTGGETGTGKDGAGNFVVNGVIEAATGAGQLLVGNSTNANTSGLQLLVTLSPSQLTGGADADITVARGIASQLNVSLQGLLDPVNGRLKLITDGFE